ncbi:gephyrin-like molybdotransferase receptor GlpR [Streptomyces sp. NPDC001985]|uniref:divisome protein SepX/GlpR n=1 Tax=Streptomyces sp. NPDC001985 TaxID=3154406 RepID=UPI0033345412
MSSSGLIYAVIVGAWAAYLVPMWLRRQDELNEARPTERFSTAIRLLSGRGAMERRYAKELRERTAEQPGPDVDPDAVTDRLSTVDVRAFAAPRTDVRLDGQAAAPERAAQPRPAQQQPDRPSRAGRQRPRPSSAATERARRGKVLARRRRTTTLLFLAFTLGSIVAAVGGLGFLWAPALPAVLLSAYIVHLRAQERRRFVVVMDRRRAEVAAQRLRENRPRRHQPPSAGPAEADGEPEPGPEPEPVRLSPQAADRRALVEQTDHAEWVDQQRDRGPVSGASWEPVPVPLPTYVTAPVAPRATSGVDLSDPETWSSARSSTASAGDQPAPPAHAAPPAEPDRSRRTPPPKRTTRDRGRTPLFDQYAEGDDRRPRAANE